MILLLLKEIILARAPRSEGEILDRPQQWTSAHRRARSNLLRACRERPRHRRAAECGQQFPLSDGDCPTPLPCEVRNRNDTMPRACSLPMATYVWVIGCLHSAPSILASDF